MTKRGERERWGAGKSVGGFRFTTTDWGGGGVRFCSVLENSDIRSHPGISELQKLNLNRPQSLNCITTTIWPKAFFVSF